MVFFTDTWKPSSIYDRIEENRRIGLHTLMLLDIKVKEQSLEDLLRARKIYQPPRFMTAAQCASQLIELEDEHRKGICGRDVLAIAAGRVGAVDQHFVCGTLKQLANVDLGRPLHSLVLLGSRTHDLERTLIRDLAVDPAEFDTIWERDYLKKQ